MTDNINGYIKPEMKGDCNVPKEQSTPKCFHIRLDNLDSHEQLMLLSVISKFAINDLPCDKVLIIEIEK